MINLNLFKSKTVYPNYDYIFDNKNDLDKLLMYLSPKLDGNVFVIVCVGLNVDESIDIYDNYLENKYIYLYLYLRKDVLQMLLNKKRIDIKDVKSQYEEFIDYIKNVSLIFDDKSLKALYYRTKGNKDKLEDSINKLIQSGKKSITVKDIDKVLINNTFIYGRDVVLSIWLKKNENTKELPLYYQRYRKLNTLIIWEQLVESLGKRHAFYSMYSFVNRIYEEKKKYLRNEDIKEESLIKIIDIKEIMYARSLFAISTERQAIAVILDLISRNEKEGKLLYDNIEGVIKL